MTQTKNLNGIIYRLYNSGQSDKILHIVDKEGKKVSLLAKGIKKPGSKKAHSIDIGNHIQAKVVEGYNIPLLTEVNLLNEFSKWKQDYQRMIFLQFFCEVIDKFAYEENHHEELFDLFFNVLNSKSEKTLLLASTFLIKLLNITGHLPPLNQCVVTSKALSAEEVYYLVDHVGYVSDEVISRIGINADKVSERVVKTQKFLIEQSFNNAVKVQLTAEEEKRMFLIELNWVENVLDQKLKSKAMVLNTIK